MKFNRNTDWSWETEVQPNGIVYYIERSDSKPYLYTAWRNNESHIRIGRFLSSLQKAKAACIGGCK